MFGGQAPAGTDVQIGEDPELGRPVDAGHYEVVFSKERLEPILKKARDQGHICVDTETDALDAVGSKLVGIALAVTPGQGFYLPLGHSAKSMEQQTRSQMDLDEARSLLAPLLADPSVVKIGQNFKYDLQVLARHGMDVVAYDDTMLMSYVLAAGLHGHGMDLLADRHFGHKTIKFEDMAGKGAKQISFADVPLDRAVTYAAEDAAVTLRLWRKLRAELVRAGKKSVYERLERPMVAVLAKMESLGVAVDRGRLKDISKELADIEIGHADRIHSMAGRDFNIGSPKQLGQVLFEEMGLPAPRKPRPVGIRQVQKSSRNLPRKALRWPKKCWAGARSPNYVPPTPTPCRNSSGRRAESTRAIPSPPPPPDDFLLPTLICKIFPSAVRQAGGSGRLSCPLRAMC